jgi:hypothetical protein
VRRVVGLLSAAAALRLALVLRGGQYFDWDEYRYGFAAIMFSRLREGDVGGALDVLFRYPEHPGFKALGLIPAAFHAVVSTRYAHPIWDMRYPTGEWIAAALFSLASVCSIGLVYAVARRSGADEDESVLAALLLFSSTNMLMHAQHFFPYDLSLAVFLAAVWLAVSPRTRDAALAGVLAGAGFAIYEGYWLLVGGTGLILLWYAPRTPRGVASRLGMFFLGVAIVPATLVAISAMRGRSLLAATAQFSETVSHGDFSEGWSLPFAFFWHAEHGLLLLIAAGVVIALAPGHARRALPWIAVVLLIYIGLVAGSNVFHRFVVYDRLARQMWPFLCLAAAAGFASVQNGRWIRGRNAVGLYGLALLLFALNARPLAMLRYPREIVGDVVRLYGAANVRFDTTLLNTVDSTSAIFLPLEPDTAPEARKRYVLLNARDIWIEGAPGTKAHPAGTIVRQWTHPRQLEMLQYHGYSPAQRRFLRENDFSICLVDTGR